MSNIFFFIGTDAEFIKVFPVIMECQNKGASCHIIASGQNNLTKSRILDFISLNGKFVELSKESDIKKSAKGLLLWFFKTERKAISIIKSEFPGFNFKNVPFVVHGDTVSTYMGAIVGKKLGCTVCHVEAGLRSHNIFNPFPEEIDRLLTSSKARLHFAPGNLPVQNLKKAKGKVVNTEYNTILDSLRLSRQMPVKTSKVQYLSGSEYFVFVMHRQENLADRVFVKEVFDKVKEVSKNMHCVLILHKITEVTLEGMGMIEEFKSDRNFTLLPRVDYFDFMKLLDGSQFVITDGGSNQEELHYMGKPCLIMRKTTERQEGIGQNAMLFGGDVGKISEFAGEYSKFRIDALSESHFPSEMIARELVET